MYKFVFGLRELPTDCIIFERNVNVRRSQRTNHDHAIVLTNPKLERTLCSFFYYFGRIWNRFDQITIQLPVTSFTTVVKSRDFYNKFVGDIIHTNLN